MQAAVRWIVLLPAALLGGWAAYLLVKLLMLQTGATSKLVSFCVETSASMAMGAACILIAHRIAPRHKVIAAALMFAVLTLAAGGMLVFATMQRAYGSIVQIGVLIFGSGLLVSHLYREYGLHDH